MNTITVSEFSLVRRLNRKLAKSGMRLRVASPRSRVARSTDSGGHTYRYFVINEAKGKLHNYFNDLAALARKLGCLKLEEEVA